MGQDPSHDVTGVERWPVYLIVIRGRFVCRVLLRPTRRGSPRGTIATLVWSPSRGGLDFGLSNRLPKPLSLLGRGTTIGLSRVRWRR